MSAKAIHPPPPSPAQTASGDMPHHGILIKLDFPLSGFFGDGAVIISLSLQNNICRAL
jgi:hypothetical protein